jgi:trimeric autotransporter adhesin
MTLIPTPSRTSHRFITLFKAWVLVLFLEIMVQAQPSSVPMEKFWKTDGPVHAILATYGTVYLGGQFSYVGQDTGGAGVVDASTGKTQKGFPKVNGPVYTAAPDGSGGWFIGGSSNSVGGVLRSNLAHIKADQTLDLKWNPDPNGSNTAILVTTDAVYVGGSFSRIGGAARNRRAALDPVTGVLKAWNPNAGGVVNAMARSGNLLYIGGNFTSLGGQGRTRLAAVDATTGVATSWNPGASAAVNAIEIIGDTIYVGGLFTTAGTRPRNRIAALPANSNVALDWNPNANGTIYALGVSGNVVYAAGAFSSIGSANRSKLAAIDASTGLALEWDPNMNGDVFTLSLAGNTVYVGGAFNRVGSELRPYAAAIDGTTGVPSSWSPNVSFLVPGATPTVFTITPAGSDLLIAGSFQSIGGSNRRNLAALDLQTGAATGWDPSPNSLVTALGFGMSAQKSFVYVGGPFTNISGLARRRLASVEADTGAATTWDPNVLGRTTVGISAILPSSLDKVYVSGNFTNIGRLPQNGLAMLDRAGDAVATFAPNAQAAQAAQSASIYALLLTGDTLYAGGDFAAIGGANYPREHRLEDGTFPSQITSGDGVQLVVEASPTMTPGSWTEVGVFPELSGTPLNFSDPSTQGQAQKFYRARLEP